MIIPSKVIDCLLVTREASTSVSKKLQRNHKLSYLLSANTSNVNVTNDGFSAPPLPVFPENRVSIILIQKPK